MRNRCKCTTSLLGLTGSNFIELQRCGLRYSSSHENDGSKYLEYDRIVSVHDAVITVPQLSSAQLHRNMQLADRPSKIIEAKHLQSVQRSVYNVFKQLTKKRLDGAEIGTSVGSLSALFDSDDWCELMCKHNYQDDSYHLRLFYFVVIGSEVIAKRDMVRINFSSPWMPGNSLRAIAASWGLQLNATATGNVCRQSVDLVEFGVNSIPCQNTVLCVSLVQKGTKSEKVYQLTWDDLRAATILLCRVKQCRYTDCQIC
jgi:hypothetical protein